MAEYFVTGCRRCLNHFVKFSVTSWKNHNGSGINLAGQNHHNFYPGTLRAICNSCARKFGINLACLFFMPEFWNNHHNFYPGMGIAICKTWARKFPRFPRISKNFQIFHRVLCLSPRHSAIPPFRLVSSVFRSAILVSRDSKGGKSPSFSCNEPCSPSFSTFRVYIHINTESPNIF